MIGDGNGLVTPINGSLNVFLYMRHTIHTAHLGMQMQFHAFFLRIIHPRCRRRSGHNVFRHDVDFLAVFIKLHIPLYPQVFAFFDLIAQFLIEHTAFYKEFYRSGIAQISDIKGNNIFFPFDLLGFHIVNASFYDHSFPNDLCINDFTVIAIDFFPKEDTFGDRRRNSRNLCIGLFLYRFCLNGSNFLAQFQQFLFLLLFQQCPLFRRSLYIFKLHQKAVSCFCFDHFHNGIIQMLLRQIICHIIFHENLHLAIYDFPFRIGNHTCADLALVTDKCLDTFPIAFRQLFRRILFQFVCNIDIHFPNAGQILQELLSQIFPFWQRDQ